MTKDISKELYCKLFINASELSRSEIKILILDLTSGIDNGRALETKNLSIDVCHNDNFNSSKYGESISCGTLDEFLYYRYFLDIFPKNNNIDQSAYKVEVGRLLEKLWNKGYKTVVACGFEDELLNRGGMGYDPAIKRK